MSHILCNAPASVIDLKRTNARPVHLHDLLAAGLPFRGGAGDLFLTNVEGGDSWEFMKGQRVRTRQFDVERLNGKIVNRGAQLWILGLKTEGADTAITNLDGASTEVLGGLLYPVAPSRPTSRPSSTSTPACP